ncbi:MAG: hypothetical protein NC215_00180 [Ruminococcus sp.]|nr:hypothetical protein [Ruminococcus sp.]
MSKKEIDEKVVSMQFNNKQFEQNVATSMSTLDKLKKSLNLEGAAKGFDSINAAAKNVDLSNISNAVDTVQMKISSLQVVGVTALANITNSIVDAGKNLVKSLSTDQISSGWQKYADKTSAVQTIMAATSSQFNDTGEQMEYVNSQLEKLNWFTDETSYNFTDMVSNIGKFTSNGIALDKSVTAMQGIANWAAISGANAQSASRAMYNIAQALSAGSVKLIDWKSIENVNMATAEFKQTAMETAAAMGTLKKQSDGTFKTLKGHAVSISTFNTTLSDSWFTNDVLMKTLDMYGEFTNKLYKVSDETEMSASQILDAMDSYREGTLNMKELSNETGVSVKDLTSMFKELTDKTMEFGEKSFRAGQEAKTFQEAIDSVKDAASTKWANIFETIFGDYLVSKDLWTNVAEELYDIFVTPIDKINKLLKGTFAENAKWDEFTKKLEKAGISTSSFESKLKEVAKESGIAIDKIIKKEDSLADAFKNGKLSTSLIVQTLKKFATSAKSAGDATDTITDKVEYFNKVVRQVIRGDFGNGEARVKTLTEAGYKYATVQGLVNYIWERNGHTWNNCTLSAEELTKAMASLSDDELKNIGYTKEQIKQFKKLAEEAEKTGTPLNELIESLAKPSGKELLLGSFGNIFTSISTSLSAIGKAWREFFKPMTSDQLYNIVAAFHKFTTYLEITDEKADKLKRTFKGVFAILDLVRTITGGALRIAFKTLSKILGLVDIDILDITASIGDLLGWFRNFVLETNPIAKGFNKILESSSGFLKKFKEFPAVVNTIKEFKEAFTWDNILDKLDKFKAKILEFIDAIKQIPMVAELLESFNDSVAGTKAIGKNIIDGFIEGLNDGSKTLFSVIADVGKKILQTIKDVLGIHSPSTEMHEVGENAIDGLVNGVKSKISKVTEVLKGVGSKFKEILGNINWNSVLAGGIGVGLIVVMKKLGDAIGKFASPIYSLSDIFKSASTVINISTKNINKILKNTAKAIKSFSFELKTKGIKNIAVAIAILAGSVAVLSLIEPKKLWGAVGAIAALGAIIGVISVVIGKFGSDKATDFGKFSLALLAMSTSILLITKALKNIGSMEPEKYRQGIEGLTAIVIAIAGILAIYGGIGKASGNIDKAGKAVSKMASTMLTFVVVMKLISGMDPKDIAKGGGTIIAFTGVIAALTAVSKLSGDGLKDLGNMLIKMSTSMLLMIAVIKLIAKIPDEDLIKGGVGILAFVGIIALMTRAVKVIGKDDKIAEMGKTLLAMSTSILLMTVSMKLIAGMSVGEIIKGGAGILALVGVLALMVKMVKVLEEGQSVAKMATTLIAMSVSIGILAGVAMLLSLIDGKGLAKGIAAIAALGGVMSLMIKSTKDAQNCKGNLIVMSVAIGVMAGAVSALSLIDGSKLAGATTALSVLMGMFAILNKASGSMNASVGSLIVMTVAVGALGGILYLLSGLPIESTLGNAAALSILLLSLASSMAIIGNFGSMSATAMASVAVMTLVVGCLAAILGVLAYMNVGSTLEIAASLSLLLISLSASCAILSVVGATGPAAFIGIGALITLVAAVGGLIAGIGALAERFPQLETFLDTGLPLLEKIGYGLGAFCGNIIGGALAGITAGLPEFGENLSAFMENASRFIDGVKGIDESAMHGVKALAQTLLILTGADVISSATKWLTGGTTFEEFGKQLVPFGEQMAKFSESVAGKIDEDAVTAVASAGKIMAEMQSALYGTGGLKQLILGEKDMTAFGTSISAFGIAIVGFADTINGKNISEETIKSAVNAGKLLNSLNQELPAMGGLKQKLLGEQDMAMFGSQIAAFGNAIVGFSQTLTANDGLNQSAIKMAADSGKLMSDLQKALPEKNWLDGKTTLDDFGKTVNNFGKKLIDYSTSVSNLNTGAITTSISTARSLKDFVVELSAVDTSGVNKLSDAISALGNVNTAGLSASVNSKLSEISAAGANITSSLNSGIRSSQSTIFATFSSILGNAIKQIKAKQNDFNKIGSALLNEMSKGIETKKTSVKKTITSSMSTSVEAINEYHDDFYQCGSYLVSGFANGITVNTYIASAKAAAMASAAARAAKEALDINSPSKVFYGIGGYAGQGFVNALNDYQSISYSAGSGIAEYARNGISNAVRRMGEVFNTDIEVNPTIRPVLDLSDVSSGANLMSNMLSLHPSVGVTADTKSISTMMNRRNQNGNGDVVSAIDKLRKDIGKIQPSVQNYIDGITYDDGSNISEAIQTLVQAARMERRR